MNQRACKDCQWFVKIDNSTIYIAGACHRFPPQVVYKSNADAPYAYEFLFPGVDADSWCAEFNDSHLAFWGKL